MIVDSLNKLASDYGYVIVLNSNRKEHQILQALTKLAESCKKEGLVMQRHPIIAGIVVRDREHFPQVSANNLRVVTDRSHRIMIASYGLHSQKETDILDGFSKLFSNLNLDSNRLLFIDNCSEFIKEATQRRWRARDASSTSFKKILEELYQEETKAKTPQKQT